MSGLVGQTFAGSALSSPEAAGLTTVSGLSHRAVRWAFVVWFLVALTALLRGPSLGEHEVIVAQTARQASHTGQWLIPHYLDTPFLMKPPLATWLVGAASALLPGWIEARWLPPEFPARLPSVVATLVTGLIVLRLGRDMFGTAAGRIAAFAYLTSVGALLFALNATVEAVLTMFCTWAFAEFWWSRQTQGVERRWHQAAFYVALGLAMLAKGPMPLIVVCLPIAVYWWVDRPLRVWAGRGVRGFPAAAGALARGAWPRLVTALGGMGLWWGVPVFLMMFLPWMLYVGGREPYFWKLWSYEYLHRLEGDYPGVRSEDYFYYVPLLLGMALPWSLSVPEALAAPFLRAYRLVRRPAVYAWCWVVVSAVLMSLMSFKKPYYLLPALPGCALLLGPVLERFFLHKPPVAAGRIRLIAVTLVVVAVVAAPVAWLFGKRMFPEEWHPPVTWGTLVIWGLLIAGLVAAVRLYGAMQRVRSLAAVGASCVGGFLITWSLLGPALGNCDDPRELVRRLRESGVPDDAPLYWASNRPDGRVVYYGGRSVMQIMDPYRLIAEQRQNVGGEELRRLAATRICELLESPSPVYFVLQRENYDTLVLFFRPPARVLFSIERGDGNDGDDDWVVLTNEGVKRGDGHV